MSEKCIYARPSWHVHVVGVHLQCRKKGPLKVTAFRVNGFSLCQDDLPRLLLQGDLGVERVVR